MKTIIAMLMLITFTATAGQVSLDKSLEKFEKLCASSKDAAIRSTNCKLAEMQKKAMKLSQAQTIK